MRGHGEGTISQRKDGRWQAQISMEGGKRKTYYGKTKKEVQEKLRVAINDQKQGKLALSSNQTVKQFLDDWLENVHKHGIRANSHALYRWLLDKLILPTIGHVKLDKLTSRQIDTLYGTKLKDGYAAETVRAMHRMLHRAFDDAVRWKLVLSNVCDNVKQPRSVEYEIHVLTKEQAQQLLEVAKGRHLEALLTLTVATGMRRGEILGLRWDDIDFEERSLYIRRTMYRLSGKGSLENDPKTAKSKAEIMLPQFAIDALLLHRTRQVEIKMKSGDKWVENDIVFCNSLGKFTPPQQLDRWFKKLLKEAHLPHMRFHDLRHSAATILLGMGVHPKLVQELLRHSNIAQTMKYSHVNSSMQRGMMDGLDAFFKET